MYNAPCQAVDFLSECYDEYALSLDGSPFFAEVECIVIRVVHKTTNKIHEFVIRLSMFTDSLDGETLAVHIVDTLKSLGLKLNHWYATSVDRAATNKKAVHVITRDYYLVPFLSFCIPRGLSNCGKKGEMTCGKVAARNAAAMVKFKLCRARSLYRETFNESARTISGVRWGQLHELLEQMNRIGLVRLRNEWASVCAEKKWSVNTARKFLDSTDSVQDLCIAMVDMAAMVDVGAPLVTECYFNEMKLFGALTIHESVDHLRNYFALGVEGFDQKNIFVELDKRAMEAADMMEENFMVSYCSYISSLRQW